MPDRDRPMHTTDIAGNGHAGERPGGDGDREVVRRTTAETSTGPVASPGRGSAEVALEREWTPATPPPPEGEPRTRAEARQAIDTTRSRISETLDMVEHRIEATRDQMREKADLARQVRERIRGKELKSLAAAFGVGVVIALLFGGRKSAAPVLSDEERQALLRWRKDRRKIMEQLRRCSGE